MKKNVFVALDNMSKEEIFSFLSRPENNLTHIKIGLEMFCKHGPKLVKEIHQRFSQKIFLDLKLHDIPNTVKKSIAALEGLPISFLTVHLSGGEQMLKEAIKTCKEVLPECQLLGVSYLTSLATSDFKEMWDLAPDQVDDAFKRLFKLAIKCQLPGLVCSAQELPLVQASMKESQGHIQTVCPGIRFKDEIEQGQVGDQKRVMDPLAAVELGVDFLVMGRSLTQSKNLSERLQYLKQINLL